MSESDEQLYTEEQAKAYAEEMVRQYGQEKATAFSFFTRVIQNPSTIRIGNVGDEELGNPQLTIRGLKELELFCRDIESNDLWADYFRDMADITTETSLSKAGFLLRLSVTQKKELADVTPKRKANRGWFKKSESSIEN